MNSDLFLSILAMDAYNRGYGQGLVTTSGDSILSTNEISRRIGNATIISQDTTETARAAGFYAIEYKLDSGETIISYRGTDDPNPLHAASDLWNGWTVGGGYIGGQAKLAIDFYESVVLQSVLTQAPNNIVLTGHSLGGGLAGYVSSLSGAAAVGFDHMPFGIAAYLEEALSLNLAVPNTSLLRGYYVEGEALQYLRNGSVQAGLGGALGLITAFFNPLLGAGIGIFGLGEGAATTALESSVSKTELKVYGADLSPVELHSQALQTILLYAATTGTLANEWQKSAPFLLPALNDDPIGAALRRVAGAGDGTYSPGYQLQTAIAYSAISEGERPFGDTAILALFDDATDLGKALGQNGASQTLRNAATALSQAMVEFAGKLAFGKVMGGSGNQLSEGVLDLSSDGLTLAANFSVDLWSHGSTNDAIVGRDALIQNALATLGGTAGAASDLATGMSWLWNATTTDKIDRVEFATTNTAVTRILPTSNNVGDNLTLSVAGDGADNITGSADDEIIVGGAGADTIRGGGGDDLIAGGTGNDTLSGGAGRDFIAGGAGVDTIALGLESQGSGASLHLSAIDAASDDQRASFEFTINGDTDRAIDVERMALTGYSDTVKIDDLGDMAGERPMAGLVIDLGGAAAGRTDRPARLNDDMLDLSSVGRVVTTNGLLGPSTENYGVRVDLRDASNQTVQYLQNDAPLSGVAPGLFGRSAVMLKTANANSVMGTQYDDVILGEKGTQGSGEGYSTLYGGAGNDFLAGYGWESHLYGGTGADDFHISGANTWVDDGTTNEGDIVDYLGIRLTGGVQQWWQEGGFAYWAPFSSLTSVFPVIGSDLIATAALFVDAVTMKFARYRLDADGTLEINLAWGLGGTSAIKNYSVDLDSGLGTAGVTVFSAGHGDTSKGGTTLQRLARFVNLALHAGFGTGLPGYDPLVLDLNGDGYQLTTEANSRVWFDYNHNGFAEHSGWVRGDDGFLVRDANSNGKIDDVSEMFGNASQGGFAMLSGYDGNHDGVINAADAIYASLQVWQDLDQDGVTDGGELKTLAQLGIVSISLATTVPTDPTAVANNQVAREGTFTLSNGVTHKLADVVFDVNPSNTHYLGDSTVSTAAAALPQLLGVGRVTDMRVAMTQNDGLRALVAAYVANSTINLTTLKSGAEAILYSWAGVSLVAATAIGSNGFDARKLAFLEKYTGTTLMPRDANGAPLLDNVTEMEQLWNDEITRLTLRLVVQGPLASEFQGITYRADLDLLVADSATSLGEILHRIIAGLPSSDHAGAVAQWAAWAPLLGALTESMVRSDNNVVRVDYLFEQLVRAMDGVSQPLTLAELASGLSITGLTMGSTAADALTRPATEDTAVYYGAGGNDTFTGGTGQDVYVFGHNVGHAVINDVELRENGDRIRFAFLNASDVTLARDGNDLLITVKATGETVRVAGQFAPFTPTLPNIPPLSRGIEDIQFADGTIYETPEIMTAVGTGTDGADHMVGTTQSDVLIGGKGNDLLEGGDDGDIYVINAGDGQDVINDVQATPLLRGADLLVLGDGIASENVVMSRAGQDGDDLLLTIGAGGQSVLIQNQFSYSSLGYNAALDTNSRIETFGFKNYGDGWSNKEVQQLLISQSETSGNDTVLGFGDDDVLDGGAGNDTLIGLDGQDTYRWGAGDGNDIIDERSLYIDVSVGLGGLSLTASADTVEFKNLNFADLVFARPTSAKNLVISDKATGETLTVYGQFDGFQTGALGPEWLNRMEWFVFGDGTRISWQDVETLVTTGGSGNDSLFGDILADTMTGGTGDDTLSGGGRGDTYVFNAGDGHDTLIDDDESFLGDGFITIDESPDILRLGPGITANDISFGRNGADVDLIIGAGGDRVTLKGQDDYIYTGVFGNLNSNRIEEIHFADGTVWTWHDLNQRMIAAATTSGNDLTLGTSTQDVFAASAGDDILDGGDGNDTYAFGRGSGHDAIRERVDNVFDGDADTLVFAAGITRADLAFSRSGDDLIITIKDTGDSMRIQNQFTWASWFTWSDVETFSFADGTTLTKDDIQHILLTPTTGDDVLVGFASNDVLDGGAGNDTLEGGDGSDTYLFGRGSGSDTIIESVSDVLFGDADKVVFGAGITLADLSFSHNGNDLIVHINGTSDQLTILAEFDVQFPYTWTDVERFEFADGSSITKEDIAPLLTIGTSGDDHIVGFPIADIIDGKGGDDILEGGDGADTYLFGRGYGHDVIYETKTDGNASDFDTVKLGAGILPGDVTLERDGTDMIIHLNTGETLRVWNQFEAGYGEALLFNDIEQIVFQDGTIWTKNDMLQKTAVGTPGNDVIYGSQGPDTLFGLAGDDYIDPSGGDDDVSGGPGNDTINITTGNDVYRWNIGDGDDRIQGIAWWDGYDAIRFGDGLNAADLRVTWGADGRGLRLSFAGQDGSILIEEQLRNSIEDGNSPVDLLAFAGGTTMTAADLSALYYSQIVTAGNDIIWLSNFNTPIIDAGAGNDTIYARDNNDRIRGGAGDDWITESNGDDTYLWSPGDGNDVVDGAGWWDGYNVIEFGAGITAANLRYASANNGDGLRISFANTSGSVTINQGLRAAPGDAVDLLRFADGSTLSIADVLAAAYQQFGTQGDDVIWMAEAISGIIDAGAGNDTIYGRDGNDRITGGAGNDTIYEAGGDDTYVWRTGDGNDVIFNSGWWDGNNTIEFGTGILPADIRYSSGSDGRGLKISFANQPGSILINDALVNVAGDGIDRLKFADGTVITQTQMLAAAVQQFGTSAGEQIWLPEAISSTVNAGGGDDIVYARSGNDRISGGTGNDVLYESPGDDTFVWNIGDGDDVITSGGWWDGFNTIEFGPGITAADLRFSYYGSDASGLKISVAGQTGSISEDAQLTGWGDEHIDQIRFADGTVMTRAQFQNAAFAQQATAGIDQITGSRASDLLPGGAGDDTFDPRYGNDRVIGGAGDDLIYESDDDDTYVWNIGDGDDVIQNYGWWDGVNTLELGSGIDPTTVRVEFYGPDRSDVRISFVGIAGSITLANQRYTSDGLDRISFANGTVWDRAYFMSVATVSQDPAADWIRGTAGNDSLYGSDASETMFGRAGDDYLRNYGGSDTYIYRSGDGSDYIDDDSSIPSDVDKLSFSDINASGVTIVRDGDNAKITIIATGAVITLDGQFNGNGTSGLEQVRFADGTIWDRAELIRRTTAQPPAFANSSAITGSIAEQTQLTGATSSDTAAGQLYFTDGRATTTHSVTTSGVSASGSIAGLPSSDTLLAYLSLGSVAEPSGTTPGSTNWTFSAPDSVFDYLRAGESVQLVFSIALANAAGESASQDVTISVTGSNDKPLVASGGTASASLTELGATTGSTSVRTAAGALKFSDADTGDTHSASIASVVATGATAGLPSTSTLLALLSLGGLTEPAGAGAGSVSWSFSAQDKTFDYLAAGQSTTLTYTVQITDAAGVSLPQTVVISVTGTNDAPVVAAGTSLSGAIAELSATSGSTANDIAAGTLRFTDADSSDAHNAAISSVTATGATAGLPTNATMLGWLSKSAVTEPSGATPGSVGWSFAASDKSFDYLSAGQSATLTYVVQLSDGQGGTLSQNVVVTINGGNDAVLIAAGTTATGSVSELASTTGSTTNDIASGVLRFTDLDSADVHSASVLSVAAVGTTSGLPANAALLAMLSTGTVTEQSGATAGSIGWTFAAADKTFDYLGAGQAVTLSYTVAVSDNHGGSVAQTVVLTVTGSNDGPTLATGATLTGTVTELAATTGSSTGDTVSGAIKFSDTDVSDTHSVVLSSVTASGITSGLPANAALLAMLSAGTLVEPAGATPGSVPWTFTAADKTFDYLGAGQTATLTYAFQLSDGHGGTLAQNVIVTITGTNDAPVVTVPSAQTARTSTATLIAGVSVADADANATETVTITTTSGTVAATASGGGTVGGSASKTLTISGSLAAVNATLATLTYTGGASAGSDTIQIVSNDGVGSNTKTIAETVSTTANHNPGIDGATTATGAFTEIAGTTGSTTADTATGLIKFTDADVPDTHTVTVSSVSASGVTAGLPTNATLLTYLTKGAVTEAAGTTPGSFSWTFSSPDKSFDYLGAGQTTTLTYVVTVTDSKSGAVTQNVVVTVTGTNDAPLVATGTTTGAITERATTTGASTADTASGALKFTDESADTHTATIASVAATGIVSGLPSSATMLAWLSKSALTEQVGSTPGSLPWSFSAPDSAFDYLAAGQIATLTYTVQITDNLGATLNQPVVVTITGANDNPTAQAKSGFTTDNWTALTVTAATLLAGATDPDTADTLSLSTVQGASGGTVALTSGNAVFTPTASAIGAASFTYTLSDGHSGTSTATVSITTTLHQINGTSGTDTLSGSTKSAQIDGLAGNDTITAGSVGDKLIGGAGADTLTGGAGIDTFIYHSGFGLDTVKSFAATGASHDIIQVDKTLFADWAHLIGATAQVGADLVITLDAADKITLKSITMANFTSADAAFV